jgi:hypothetical protein
MDQQGAASSVDAIRDVAFQEVYDQGTSSTGIICAAKVLRKGSETAQSSAGLGNYSASKFADAAPDPACPRSTATLRRDRGRGQAPQTARSLEAETAHVFCWRHADATTTTDLFNASPDRSPAGRLEAREVFHPVHQRYLREQRGSIPNVRADRTGPLHKAVSRTLCCFCSLLQAVRMMAAPMFPSWASGRPGTAMGGGDPMAQTAACGQRPCAAPHLLCPQPSRGRWGQRSPALPDGPHRVPAARGSCEGDSYAVDV